MKIANISLKNKKFRVSKSMASTCNCGACNCNCGGGSSCSHIYVSSSITKILNSQIEKLLNA